MDNDTFSKSNMPLAPWTNSVSSQDQGLPPPPSLQRRRQRPESPEVLPPFDANTLSEAEIPTTLSRFSSSSSSNSQQYNMVSSVSSCSSMSSTAAGLPLDVDAALVADNKARATREDGGLATARSMMMFQDSPIGVSGGKGVLALTRTSKSTPLKAPPLAPTSFGRGATTIPSFVAENSLEDDSFSFGNASFDVPPPPLNDLCADDDDDVDSLHQIQNHGLKDLPFGASHPIPPTSMSLNEWEQKMICPSPAPLRSLVDDDDDEDMDFSNDLMPLPPPPSLRSTSGRSVCVVTDVTPTKSLDEQAWTVSSNALKPPPPCYPLERTSKFIPNLLSDPASTQDNVQSLTDRISVALAAQSVATSYDGQHAKATCRTLDGVDFRVRLYQGRGESFQHGVIVEVQRRSGFSLTFHETCNAVLDAAVAVEETPAKCEKGGDAGVTRNMSGSEDFDEDNDETKKVLTEASDTSFPPPPPFLSSGGLPPPPALQKQASSTAPFLRPPQALHCEPLDTQDHQDEEDQEQEEEEMQFEELSSLCVPPSLVSSDPMKPSSASSFPSNAGHDKEYPDSKGNQELIVPANEPLHWKHSVDKDEHEPGTQAPSLLDVCDAGDGECKTETTTNWRDKGQFTRASSLLQRDQLDANLLGMKMLCALTSPSPLSRCNDDEKGMVMATPLSPLRAPRSYNRSVSSQGNQQDDAALCHARMLLLDAEGRGVRDVVFALVERGQWSMSPPPGELSRRRCGNPATNEGTTGSPSTVEKDYSATLRRHAIQALTNAIHVLSKHQYAETSNPNHQVPNSFSLEERCPWILHRMIPTLVSDLKLARDRPHEASLAASCLCTSMTASEAVRRRAIEAGCAAALRDAAQVGKRMHSNLALESMRCASMIEQR